MTNEELLVPRYLVIADYPGSDLVVGEILIKHVFPKTDNYCYVTNADILLLGKSKRKEEVESFPHLFRSLAWYEEREREDMPEYVKLSDGFGDNSIHKWGKGKAKKGVRFGYEIDKTPYILLFPEGGGLLLQYAEGFLPATKEEFDIQNNAK